MRIMKIQQVKELTAANVVCGAALLDKEVSSAFASDLMSDVLTLDCNEVLLVTGLCNLQTIRTAEMAEVSCILFVRGKKVTPEMIELAEENQMILLETPYSMYRTVGLLYSSDLRPVY
ncbi:putative transcriptional regulator [Parabacteroides sp. PFB2-12]|nr:putative transcriptional regulator [Parabacteroides sp. PM6-13]MDH6391996.1 putative transcriptional regulator [Parabacteroides sp. PFB2-12]